MREACQAHHMQSRACCYQQQVGMQHGILPHVGAGVSEPESCMREPPCSTAHLVGVHVELGRLAHAVGQGALPAAGVALQAVRAPCTVDAVICGGVGRVVRPACAARSADASAGAAGPWQSGTAAAALIPLGQLRARFMWWELRQALPACSQPPVTPATPLEATRTAATRCSAVLKRLN